MRVTVLQHVPFEGPGAIAPWLRAHGHSVEICALFEGQPLPSLNELEALVVMGGPMGVHDTGAYPWLGPECDLLQKVMSKDLPLLGICLGAQLMALALGAEVHPGPSREIGWWPLQVEAGALPIQSGSEVFHWHGDRFDLPENCQSLARTEPCPHQAFRLGRALGLQFHLETTPEGVDALIRHGQSDLTSPGPWVQAPQAIRSNLRARCDQLNRQLAGVLEAWISA